MGTLQTGEDSSSEDKEHHHSKDEDDYSWDCIVVMEELLMFLSERGEDKADDVDNSWEHSDDDVGLIGVHVDHWPAPRYRHDRSRNNRLSDVLKHHVEDLKNMDSRAIKTVDDEMNETIEVPSSKHD